MRVLLDGIALETTKYAENGDIRLTCYTDADEPFQALSAAMESGAQMHDLRRGGEQLAVRLCEYEVSPPYSRRLDGVVHRHDIRLEFAPQGFIS